MITGCTCFINPPCYRCVESYFCSFCGENEHPDQGGEVFEGSIGCDDEFLCSGCVAKVELEGVK